jgi:hypothetical protein
MISKSSQGIPRIIHQTWKDENVSGCKGSPDSWKDLNPGWQYRFWTDGDLQEFMREEFPDLVPIFNAYPNSVQRADLWRYCVLWRIGGVYADIDTDCLAQLEPLYGDHRVILCQEPPQHVRAALLRGMSALWFNGTMASPAGHNFWSDVVDLCHLMARHTHRDVVETTGPLLLSAAVERWSSSKSLSLNSCNLFAPVTENGNEAGSAVFGPHGHLRLSRHNWAGSWYDVTRDKYLTRRIARIRQVAHYFTRGKTLDPAKTMAGIDRALAHAPLPAKAPFPQVAIFILVRNGLEFLMQNFELIRSLDYPKHRLRIVYCLDNKDDQSAALISEFHSNHGDEFYEIVAFHHATDIKVPRYNPAPEVLRRRQLATLAQMRNTMLRRCLTNDDAWVLWLDVDIRDFESEVLKRLLEAREKIIIPNCVIEYGGLSCDRSSFLEIKKPGRSGYYQHMSAGIFQPPANYWPRRHFDDLRYLPRVPLHGVGATMLLVQADIHRAGVNFPELPYKDLIDTEAFGYLARDVGLIPIGLPNTEILCAE